MQSGNLLNREERTFICPWVGQKNVSLINCNNDNDRYHWHQGGAWTQQINYPLTVALTSTHLQQIRRPWRKPLTLSILSMNSKQFFCIFSRVPRWGDACWGRTYLQSDVLQQRVLQHRLQLPVNLQRQVQGQPAVRRVGGVKRGHDAPPSAEVGLVNVRRLC